QGAQRGRPLAGVPRPHGRARHDGAGQEHARDAGRLHAPRERPSGRAGEALDPAAADVAAAALKRKRYALRFAWIAIATSAAPPKIMLMPTSRPSAQAAVAGRPARIIAASTRSMMPLTSIHSQRPDSSLRCSSAYMIDTAPSIAKNAISS